MVNVDGEVMRSRRTIVSKTFVFDEGAFYFTELLRIRARVLTNYC